MGTADSSRRIRVGDIELANRITGRGKPVILIHNAGGDGRRHARTFVHELPAETLAFLGISVRHLAT
jgi:hypothetical protein